MTREARWAWLSARGRTFAALSVVAAVALLSAPAAEATDGGSHAYLPEKKDWCLGVGAPELTGVGTRHALLRLEYWDDCLFPAKSSVEIRTGDGGWREVDSDFTKTGDRQSKKWTVRIVRLGDLRNDTRYYVRSRIDYVGDTAHTSDLTFRTGGDPAREMRAQGSFGSGQGDVAISLSAIIPDAGKNVPSAVWVAPAGWEQFSDEQVWKEEVPYLGKLTRECHQFSENYSKCTWQFKWRVSIGIPRPIPPFWWKDGLEYRVHFCIENNVYSGEFGVQCTKEFTVKPGKATQVDVGQAP
jgi:hypothetical protein